LDSNKNGGWKQGFANQNRKKVYRRRGRTRDDKVTNAHRYRVAAAIYVTDDGSQESGGS